jgi:hypothetical protein
MSTERKLKFRLRRPDGTEIELEGEHDYVKAQFEQLVKELPASQIIPSTASQEQPILARVTPPIQTGAELEGIIERTPDGRPHLTIPADNITAKEAVAIMLFAHHPNQLSYEDLSNLLSSSWKTTKSHVVRARASELKKEGKLIVESGKYGLSGAGVQWVRSQILPKLRLGAATI